jgi:general secretion pathway protein I
LKRAHLKVYGYNSHYSRAGFTLLEIMVALSIVAIVLVSVYRLHAQTISMNQAARFYTTAPLLAQRKMAEIETISLKELADDTGSFDKDYPDYRWAVAVGEIESEALGQTADSLKTIDVTVSFGTDQLTYSLRTYRFYSE